MPARPGGVYELSVHALAEGLVREVNDRGIEQFDNSYAAIFLFDTAGELVGRALASPDRPDTDGWQALSCRLEAPESTRRAEVRLFLSVSGDLWFDDLELHVEGGEAVEPPRLLFLERFESVTGPPADGAADGPLPAEWEAVVGARNGGETPLSTAGVSPSVSIDGLGGSLHLAGNRETLAWRSVQRALEAAPGDRFELEAQVRGEGLGAERNVLGIDQFVNAHASLTFVDAEGAVLGAPRYAHLPRGSFDWLPVEVGGVAPEGTTHAVVAFFLSMTGEVWVDDIAVTRRTGGRPPYADWGTTTTEHLVLRYPPDHPFADGMEAYGARLEEALDRVRKALRVRLGAPITVYLYRDGEQGRRFTGRDLDFAEAERRAVHQRPQSTLAHELTHVVARQLGAAGDPLLGEGLAVWLDGRPGADHHARAAALLADGAMPDIQSLLLMFRDLDAGYPAAGSFCGWLLYTYGLETFQQLYTRRDLGTALPVVTGASLDELEAAWHAFIRERA